MVSKRIPALTEILGSGLDDADHFVAFDTNADETKRVTWAQLKTVLQPYDADTAKLDVAQTWTALQEFKGGLSVEAFDSSSTAAVILSNHSGVARWFFGKNATSESGANAGSDLDLYTYDDAGGIGSLVFRVTRSTGVLNFSVAPTILGNTIYRAGGTDVAIADGGTGASDQATARSNLGLAALAVLSSVSTAQIDNSAVTYAKIQNVSATDRILGRSTAGAGVVEEIVCTAFGRSLLDDASDTDARTTLGLGSSNNVTFANVTGQDGTFEGNLTIGKSSVASTYTLRLNYGNSPGLGRIVWTQAGTDRWSLSSGSDGNLLLTSSAVAAAVFEIDDTTRVTNFFVAPTILGNTIYRAGGTDVAIADGGTGASDQATARSNLGLAALAVLSSVGTAQIDDNAVTYAKIQDVSATSRILGRITAGSGDIEELTAANVKTILALTQNDIANLTTTSSPSFSAITTTTGSSRMVGVSIGADADIYLYESATDEFTIRYGPSSSYRYATFGADGRLTLLSGALYTPGLVPVSNDGGAIGSASLQFSDLYLASGALIDFANNNVRITHSTGLLTLTGRQTIQVANANAFAVGANGSTNPVFNVNSATASVATGIEIIGAAAAARVALNAISSGTNEGLSINAKGTGTIRLGVASTGAIEFSRNAVPTTNDGAALGTTALMWADLFLASGAVLNFNNGDITLTHSTDNLSGTGGQFRWTHNGAVSPVVITNTQDAASSFGLIVEGDRATPTSFDAVQLLMRLSDSAGNQDAFVSLIAIAPIVTSGSEQGRFDIALMNGAGVSTTYYNFTTSTLRPNTNDGVALGQATLAFADLFLASGGVVNWDNGNFTVTHAAGQLTFSGNVIVNGTMRGRMPRSSETGGTLTATSSNTIVNLASAPTIQASVHVADDSIVLYNNTAGALTITQGAGGTQRLAGTTTTGNLTLAARGRAVVHFVSATEWIVDGNVT